MIRIATARLCALLTDMIVTTAPEDSAYPIFSNLVLYTDRGYPHADEPGQSDVLVGMSTNRRVAAHAFVDCDGQATPMLWPVSKALTVIQMFKPKTKTKGGSDHGVTISRDGDHVIVQEDPNLFDDGDQFTFKLGDVEDYPTQLVKMIADMPPLGSKDTVKARTDFHHGDLALLCQIAKRRNTLIETYRVHQDQRLLVQIGPYWRGWIRPVPYEIGKERIGTNAWQPDGEVFYPGLLADLKDDDPFTAAPPRPEPEDQVLPLAPEPEPV